MTVEIDERQGSLFIPYDPHPSLYAIGSKNISRQWCGDIYR